MKKKKSSITKALRFLVSYEFFFSLAACITVWSCLAVYFLNRGLWGVFDLMPVKVFMLLLFSNRLLGFIAELAEKRKTALLTAGVLFVLSGFFLNYAYRFEGRVALGEGESLSGYEKVQKGPLGRPPELSLTLGNVEGKSAMLDKGAKAELYNDGIKAVLAPGQYKNWSSGTRTGILSIEEAPRFLIKDKSDKELSSAFVKLRLYPRGVQDYFLIPELPHRFYLSLTDRDDKPFNLKILRGKLVVASKNTAGEEVKFGGFRISFPEIGKWADIKVKYYPGDRIVYLGLVIIALGGIIMLLYRSGTK